MSTLLLGALAAALVLPPPRAGSVSMRAAAPDALPLPLSLLAPTNLGGKRLARCYRASADGWSALDWHRQVDELGSIVVVGLLESGDMIGGYNPTGYDSLDDYRATPRAFVFCSRPRLKSEGDADEAARRWEQCAVLGPGDIAIFDYARGGPQFGAADLVIGSPLSPVMGGFAGPDTMDDTRTAGDLRSVRASLGGSYARLPKGAAPFPTGELVELEAYCNAAVAQRPDAWNPARTDRASKAPELIVNAEAEGDAAAAEEEPPQTVGWWPW